MNSAAEPDVDLFRRPLLRDRWFISGLVLALVVEVVSAWEHKVGGMIVALAVPFVVGFWRRDLTRGRQRLGRWTSRPRP